MSRVLFGQTSTIPENYKNWVLAHGVEIANVENSETYIGTSEEFRKWRTRRRNGALTMGFGLGLVFIPYIINGESSYSTLGSIIFLTGAVISTTGLGKRKKAFDGLEKLQGEP